KAPKAFVGVGSASDWAGRIIDLERAALKAAEKYRALGYEVEENLSATVPNLNAAIKTSCYQCVWITGHGRNISDPPRRPQGTIAMDPSYYPNIVDVASMHNEMRNDWNCERDPFVRELVLLGCETYDATWRDLLVCGVVHSFDYLLFGNLGGQALGRNPYIWELKNHSPPPPHN